MQEKRNHKIMQNFGLRNIPDLDVCVLGALEMLADSKLPKVSVPYKRPLVVGSGNAEAVGRIIFGESDALFASESNYEEKLRSVKTIDGVVIVSASGGKHAPIVAKMAKKFRKKISLITNNPDSMAGRYADKVFVSPKQREPYTYNTSTYMGMVLGKTRENPRKIYDFIKGKVAQKKMPDFGKYKKYYLIVPPEFSEVTRMLNVKFIELFGRQIAREVETSEYVKHATTVVPSEELFISFGRENKIWGENRFFVPLPKNADYGAMIAVGYYVVGRIQREQRDYFKKNIEGYTNKVSKIFGQEIEPIVE